MTTKTTPSGLTSKDYYLYAQIWIAAATASGETSLLLIAVVLGLWAMFMGQLEREESKDVEN